MLSNRLTSQFVGQTHMNKLLHNSVTSNVLNVALKNNAYILRCLAW